MGITPNQEQFIQLAVDSEAKPGEVVMLNLLKYKDRAEDVEGGSGEEAYARYGRKAVEMVEERGGEVLWMGRPDQVLIGDVEADAWDAVALVRYPSRKAFLDMVSQPDYQKAHEHREGGLERTVLLAMTPAPGMAAGDAAVDG
jgi:uncharacterized protein (DUF1330 family)